MATLDQARPQVSKDLNDDFSSVTTTIGNVNKKTLIDVALGDWDTDSFFLARRRSTVFILSADEERFADVSVGLTGSPIDTLTVTRAFTSQVANSANYEVHRMYSALQKELAINAAVDLCWPQMFIPVETTITLVAQQMDYDVSAAGLFRDAVRQVKVQSTADTEHWVRVFNWEMRHDDTSGGMKLHFFQPPDEARTIHIFGHKKMALTDYTVNEDLLVLSAKAAVYLIERDLSTAVVDERSHLERMLALNEKRFRDRATQYKRQSIPFTIPSQMVGRKRFNVFEV